ncbi:hypothetical protein [Fodinibius saliphilus]|uniref:hypothetical protein n=1 Tax=Fodinibius saliphilus TaxID=1920650 RepID=UPI00148705A9|nr:hypothetical protein [Fodinibius saliphilus]
MKQQIHFLGILIATSFIVWSCQHATQSDVETTSNQSQVISSVQGTPHLLSSC